MKSEVATRKAIAPSREIASRSSLPWPLCAALAAALSLAACSPSAPPEAPGPPAHARPGSTSPAHTPGQATAAVPATSAAAQTAVDPDSDGDGIPDRCDACPLAGGMLWEGYPGIDGCGTAAFHSLVWEPTGTAIQVRYETKGTDGAPPAPETLDSITSVFKRPSIDAIALVGRFAGSGRAAEALARERARRLGEALKTAGVTATLTVLVAPGPAPLVDIAVLRQNGREELRWKDGAFEHMDLAAFREAQARARAARSPCGRAANAPMPPPP